VDGTRQTVLTASKDTIRPVATANGYIAYEVVTETVRNVVRTSSTVTGWWEGGWRTSPRATPIALEATGIT